MGKAELEYLRIKYLSTLWKVFLWTILLIVFSRFLRWKTFVSSGKIQLFPSWGSGANPVIFHAHLADFPLLPGEGWDTWNQRLVMPRGVSITSRAHKNEVTYQIRCNIKWGRDSMQWTAIETPKPAGNKCRIYQNKVWRHLEQHLPCSLHKLPPFPSAWGIHSPWVALAPHYPIKMAHL